MFVNSPSALLGRSAADNWSYCVSTLFFPVGYLKQYVSKCLAAESIVGPELMWAYNSAFRLLELS